MRRGQVIGRGRYRLGGRLGRGGYAEVWQAEVLAELDGRVLQQVAVKAFNEGMSWEECGREIEQMAALSHENVLRYVDHFREPEEDQERLCLVMELADGGSLEKFLKAWPEGVPEEQVGEHVLEVARALAYIHGEGRIHRDVKPQNILLVGERVKLGDVGLMKALEGEETRDTGRFTLMYAAPEVLSARVGQKSDVWGLGVTAYELLTGHTPFCARGAKIPPEAVMRAILDEPVQLPASLSRHWQRLLSGCLEKDPQQRWSAAQVVGCLEAELRSRQEDPRLAMARAEISRLQEELEAALGRVAGLALLLSDASRPAERGPLTSPGTPAAQPPALPVPLPAPPAVPQLRTEYDGRQFVIAPAGRFVMGSPDSEKGRDSDEGPQHLVHFTRRFLVQTTPVTQAQWWSVMGNNPSNFQGPSWPVEQVSWFDAVAYCNALSRKYGLEEAYVLMEEKGKPGDGSYSAAVRWKGLDSPGFRLPTEAEWEYAARAGSQEVRPGPVDFVAWYDGNSGGKTHPVGELMPNAWGLYDMLGNVWEWAWDWMSSYSADEQVQPTGPTTGSSRVYRGGSWSVGAQVARVAYRHGVAPSRRLGGLGFRVVRSLP